jgi:hypothetical protein
MDKSLKGLIATAGNPVSKDINGIPGYSALWVLGEADYFRHSGDLEHLRSVQKSLCDLLEFMASRVDDHGLLQNLNTPTTFVDWSPDFDGDSTESRRVTLMEFLCAFSEGAWLLGQAGDQQASQRFRALADQLRGNTLRNALDPAKNIFGGRWQTNTMAIYAGLADEQRRAAVWENVLSRPYSFTVTPHLNSYAIEAMALAGRRKEALDWIRQYWGGMLRADTSTFWEGFDARWPQEHFHGHLQSAHAEGYFVSLCHGWASGPTSWLMEQVLGIRPLEGGFKKLAIRPDLCDLRWARGSEPTPQGLINGAYRQESTEFRANVELPPGVTAQVSMPVDLGEDRVWVDGQPVSGVPAEQGTRIEITLNRAGLHELRSHLSSPVRKK